jgi:hypothetical protein
MRMVPPRPGPAHARLFGAALGDGKAAWAIARDMQPAGAGIRSLAEPFLDTASDFAESP